MALQVCPQLKLIAPLVDRHIVRDQAQNAFAHASSSCNAHQTLASTTWQHDDACSMSLSCTDAADRLSLLHHMQLLQQSLARSAGKVAAAAGMFTGMWLISTRIPHKHLCTRSQHAQICALQLAVACASSFNGDMRHAASAMHLSEPGHCQTFWPCSCPGMGAGRRWA